MSRTQWIRVGRSEPANGMDVFTMTDASAFRIIQDTCCPATCIVVRAENTFQIAIAEAIIHDQWPTIVVTQKKPMQVGCTTINRADNSPCVLCWAQGECNQSRDLLRLVWDSSDQSSPGDMKKGSPSATRRP